MKFRFKAQRKMNDPDDLNTTTRLADPTSWITVFVCLLVLVAAVVWGFLGHLPRTTTGTGVLTRPQGVIRIQSQIGGVVEHVDLTRGQQVSANSQLMTVVSPDGATRAVIAPEAGSVFAVYVAVGDAIPAGTTVLSLERMGGGAGLSAALLVPASQANLLRPGEPVHLSASEAPARAFGLLRGRVLSVSAFRADTSELRPLVVDDQLINSSLTGSPKRLVIVELTRDSKTASGYSWTSAKGPPFAPPFQSNVTGSITRDSVTPIDYLFGA